MSVPYGQDIPLGTLISVASDAARQAGAVLADCTRTGFRIEHKQIINLVTDADYQAEQRIIDIIHGAFPTHRILAEERGLTEQPPSRCSRPAPASRTTRTEAWC